MSLRYAYKRQDSPHWFGFDNTIINNQGGQHVINIQRNEYGNFIEQGVFEYINNREVKQIRVFSPERVVLNPVPNNVSKSTQGTAEWKTQFFTHKSDGDVNIRLDKNQPFSKFIKNISFVMNSRGESIEERRFYERCNSEILFSGNDSGRENLRIESTFEYADEKVAIGFSKLVDGIKLDLNIPESYEEFGLQDKHVQRGLRISRYYNEAESGIFLSSVSNKFERLWIAEVVYAGILLEANTNDLNLEDAFENVITRRSAIKLEEILEIFFSVVPPETNEDEQGQSTENRPEHRLVAELRRYLREVIKPDELRRLVELLWVPIDDSWNYWLEKVFSFTLGSAFLVAVEDLCPAIPEGQLRLDIGSVDERERNVLFITEIERGGIGHIENFYEEFIKNPNKFYHLVRRNLDRSILKKLMSNFKVS